MGTAIVEAGIADTGACDYDHGNGGLSDIFRLRSCADDGIVLLYRGDCGSVGEPGEERKAKRSIRFSRGYTGKCIIETGSIEFGNNQRIG